MAINPNKTRMDWNTALKNCVDANEDALRIILTSAMELQMELDAEDGDSVLAFPKSDILTEGEMDAKRLKRGMLFSSGVVSVEVSPLDSGDVWLSISTMNTPSLAKSAVLDLCCRRIRLVKSEGAVAYFVGQS